MSRLSTLSSNPTLRNFAQGASQSAIRPVANFLAPPVPVPTMVGKHKIYTAKNQFHVPETLRGLGGRATRIGFTAADGNYNCQPHGLDFPIDNLEKLEGDQLMSMARYGATLVADVGALAHEVAVINKALAALGAGTDHDFDADAVDPVKVIDAQIRAMLLVCKNGAKIKIVLGLGAWLDIKNNVNVRGRIVVGVPGGIANVTLEMFGKMLLTEPKIELSMMVQDTAAEGVAESMSFLLDQTVIIFASSDNPTTLDPSFMKTFRLDGQWMVPGSYQTEDGRGEVLKMDWSEDVQVTNTAAGVRLNNADA